MVNIHYTIIRYSAVWSQPQLKTDTLGIRYVDHIGEPELEEVSREELIKETKDWDEAFSECNKLLSYNSIRFTIDELILNKIEQV